MSPLRWALLVAAGWFALAVAVAWIDTEVVRKGQLTPQQDAHVSYVYGQLAGGGALLAGVGTFLILGGVTPKK